MLAAAAAASFAAAGNDAGGGGGVGGGSGASITSKQLLQLAQLAQRKRRIAGLFQHYYPEGGWGYVVLACGVAVQAVAHGAQLSFGVLALMAWRRWGHREIADFADTGRTTISNHTSKFFLFHA